MSSNNKEFTEVCINLPTLSIIMPCLNEEQNVSDAVQSTLSELDRYGINGELIIVNDGSTDRTEDIARKLQVDDKRIRIINHKTPQGIGASFWEGVQGAKNQFVTMFPGDNENDPSDALTYFYMANDVDIIVPFIQNVEVRSYARRIISSLYRFIINISFGTNLNYTNGTVIYNTSVLREMKLKSTGFFYQAEILITLIRIGYLYAETPHFLSQRNSGKTKALSIKSLLQVISGHLRLTWDIHIARKIGATDVKLHTDSATYRRCQARKERRRYARSE